MTATIDADRESRSWVSAHLYFHGDLDDVVAGVVDPVLRDTVDRHAHGEPHFFLRYWEGGPHVRLRVRIPPESACEPLRAGLRAHAEQYFARCPSADRIGHQEYREIRQWAVRLEPWTTPATELRPNNSIRFEPYRAEYDRYGRGRSLAAVERHFAESSEIARTVVCGRMSAPERDLLALCALVTSWSLVHPDEGGLAAWVTGGGARFDPAVAADDQDARGWATEHADTVRAVVRHTLDVAARPDGGGVRPDSLRGRWTRSVRTLCASLGDEGRPGVGSSADGPPSRVVDHCAHLLCNRIGLGLSREASLRSLAARAVLDVKEGR